MAWYIVMAETFARIQQFLSQVRGVLRGRAALRAGLYCVAALSTLALVVPLSALLMAAHRGAVLGWSGLIAAGLIAFAGLVRPWRRWRSQTAIARFVGSKQPPLASDLLSSVELGGQRRVAGRGQGSADLVAALLAQTAARLEGMDPRALVARAPVRRAAAFCTLMVVLHGAAWTTAPGSLAAGWRRVLEPRDTRPFGGAELSQTPLVGDIRVTLEYPDYSRQPALVLPSSSGDFRAMPGTSVTLETRALVPAAAARLVFDGAAAGDAEDAGAETDIVMEVVDERTLRARFAVHEAGAYRFLIDSPRGRRRVEAVARQIEIDADKTPEVELYVPAEELDVTSMKRIELAYIAEDDFGISKIELVWSERGKEQRKGLPVAKTGGQPRSAQQKFLWDLAEVTLEPGTRVAYHLEVTDNDTVRGPNVGRSREFQLRVFSPREKHEQLIARQVEFFEKLVRSLGGRLTVAAADVHAHTALHREVAGLVVELGTLVTALGAEDFVDKALRVAFEEMRARLDGLSKAEAVLLGRYAGRQAAPGSKLPDSHQDSNQDSHQDSKQVAARLGAADADMVAEMENDVITLADWLDRQQMENLLALSDEVKVHEDRLRQLFKEFERTGSQELLVEIEREMRALERRLAEMAHKRGQLAEDVLDRFVHSEAIQEDEARDCMGQVRALMTAGQVDAAQAKLEECLQSLDKAAEAMEQALSELRGDKFSESERKLGELMDKLADLSQDQRDLAGAADDIWNRYAARADDMMREEAKGARKEVSKLIDRLRKEIARVPEAGLTQFAKEELEIVEARLRNVDEMLADGDIAEALAMAQQARSSLDTAASEIEAAMEDDADEPWTQSMNDARRALGRAQPLADKLVEELQASTPSPGEIMSEDDRRQLNKLRKRQKSVAERARRLMERAQQMSGELPGKAGDAVAQGVGEARGHMSRAGKRMRAQDPAGVRQETRGAADSLERTLQGARDAARGRGAAERAGLRDEPIRIPGADEYKAPEEFREDILEAMKREQAPKGFGDLVKRYYEELIR
jgi:ribosomal protein S20